MYNYAKDNDFQPLVAGGMAGLANWGLTYPLDVIKTHITINRSDIRNPSC